MQVMKQTSKVIHLGFETQSRHHQKSKTGVLWSIQTELKWDRDRVRMGHCHIMQNLNTATDVGRGPVPILWHCISPGPGPIDKFCLQ